MRLVLTESRFLKDSIGVISELVNEVTIKVGKNALELVAMDPANVAMVTFKLLSSAFAEYDVPKEVDLGLNLESFKEILRRVKPTDTLVLVFYGAYLIIDTFVMNRYAQEVVNMQ